MVRVFTRAFIVIALLASFIPILPALSQDAVGIEDVATPVRTVDIGGAPAGFGVSAIAFKVGTDSSVFLPFDHPALNSLQPERAVFARGNGAGQWHLVETDRDLKARRLVSKLEAGFVYTIVGPSRFDAVYESQRKICESPATLPLKPVTERICSQVLCPASAMDALSGVVADHGADMIAGMPGAGEAAQICQQCLDGSLGASRPLECRIDGAFEDSSERNGAAIRPWWPIWPVWASAKQSEFCTPGSHAVGETRYSFSQSLQLPAPFGGVDVAAEVRYPAMTFGEGATPVQGSFPLAVFLHGNHCVCGDGTCTSHNQCSPADRIPNHRGYDYIMDVLASQGFVALSIDGYHVTARNGSPLTMTDYEARGQLVIEHLRRFRDWQTGGGGPIDAIAALADLDTIGLIGHSRGGEGVVAADVINTVDDEGFGIGAVVAIAPTDQDQVVSWTPISPYMVILPNNDGDVSTLQGQRTYDRAFRPGGPDAAEKSLVWIFGANHNFFNTTWTPGSGDPTASDDGQGLGRLSPAAQRSAGCEVIGGFLRKELKSDASAASAFRGEVPFHSLQGLQMYLAHARPDALVIDNFDQQNGDLVNTLGGAVNTSGTFSVNSVIPFTISGPEQSFRGETNGLILSANGTARYETAIPSAQRDIRRYKTLSIRIGRLRRGAGSPPPEQPADLIVTLVDTAGNEANQRFPVTTNSSVPYPAAGAGQPTIPTTTRLRLAKFRADNKRFDFSKVASVVFQLNGNAIFALDDIAFEDRGRSPFPWVEWVFEELEATQN